MEQQQISAKKLMAMEKVKRANAELAKVVREEKEQLRKTEDRHKYMMGGCVVKYFPEAYDFSEQEIDRFTDEELELCRQTDLVQAIEHLGYHLKKEGSVYTIPAMDSIKIFHRRTYTRFSDYTGGSSIDFLINVAGMDWKEAVEWLLDFNGRPRHASLRGTYSEPSRRPFKGSVIGSDTGYTFNLVNPDSDMLVVCEAAIDVMSYLELAGELSSEIGPCNCLALSGTHDRSLERFLSENDHIRRIVLALDADEPGQTACERIREKYLSEPWDARGFQIEIRPPAEGKDYNELLIAEKSSMCI